MSLLSGLARLDIDPWQEALSLDQMASPAAAERLRRLIVALPDDLFAAYDAGATAERLVALLPKATVGATRPTPPPALLPTAEQLSRFLRFALLNLIFMGVILGVRHLIADNVPATQPVATVVPPAAAATVARPSPSVVSGPLHGAEHPRVE